jgi:hypothetical protein
MATRTKTINDNYTNEILKQEFNTLLFHSTGKKLYLKSNPLKGIVTYCVVRNNLATGNISETPFDIFEDAKKNYNKN